MLKKGFILPKTLNKSNSNGCLLYDLGIDSSKYFKIQECCSTQYSCYNQCFTKKEKCDDNFRKCIAHECSTYINLEPSKSILFLLSYYIFLKFFFKSNLKECSTILKIIDSVIENTQCNLFNERKQKSCSCVKKFKK